MLGKLKLPSKAALKAALKESAIAVLGGVAAGTAFDLLTEIDIEDKDGVKAPLFGTAIRRGLLAAGLGLIGGRVLWTKSRTAAHGVLGAMGAEGARMAIASVRAAVAAAGDAPATGLSRSQIYMPTRVNGNELAGGRRVNVMTRPAGSVVGAMA